MIGTSFIITLKHVYMTWGKPIMITSISFIKTLKHDYQIYINLLMITSISFIKTLKHVYQIYDRGKHHTITSISLVTIKVISIYNTCSKWEITNDLFDSFIFLFSSLPLNMKTCLSNWCNEFI